MDVSGLDISQLQIFLKLNWGLDGSGDHSDYHQLSKVSYSTKQIMSECFSLKEVEVKDNSGVSGPARLTEPTSLKTLGLLQREYSANKALQHIKKMLKLCFFVRRAV